MTPDDFAKELLSVQPIDSKIFKNLLDCAMTEKQLVDEGYTPVNSMKLLWYKKVDKSE